MAVTKFLDWTANGANNEFVDDTLVFFVGIGGFHVTS